MSDQRVNPQDGNDLTGDKDSGSWARLHLARLNHVTREYRPIAWLVFLSASLVLFILWMPPAMRIVIWNGLIAQGTLSSMLLIFSLVALSLVWSAGQRIDVWGFLIFNLRGLRPLWLDRMMLGITQIGSGIAAAALGLVLYLAGDHLMSYEIILGTLTLWIVVELVKAIVRRSRPFIRLSQARVVGTRAIGRSFPSGHTSQAFFTATLVAQHYHANALLVLLLYSLALLIGITRMYVGAHYPRDVLAGALLGSAWGLLGVLVDGYLLGPG